MSDERAVEAVQLSQPAQTESPQISVGCFEPHQLAELARYGRLYVLADGVSGTASGHVVSRYAVKKILHSFYTADTLDPKTRLLEAIQQANLDIFERNKQYPERRVMATTLIAALIRNSKLLVANVGDSRVYVVWDQDIECLEQDDSLATDVDDAAGSPPSTPLLLAKTETTQESQTKEPKPGSLQQQIFQSLGLDKEIKIDTFSRRLFAGDTVILCSGGLTGYITEKEIARAVNRYPPEEAIRRLMALTGERGNRDHVAISIARVLSSPVAMRPPTPMTLPSAPKWSDWETLPEPAGKTSTQPIAKPVSLPAVTKPDPAAQARLRLTEAQRTHKQTRLPWPNYALVVVVLVLLCAALLLAWQYLLPADLVAAVPFLGDIGALKTSGDESLDPHVTTAAEIEPELPGQADPVQTPAEPTATPSPQRKATVVAENNSPIPTPEATFISPVSTPATSLPSQEDTLTVATASPEPVILTPSPTPLPTIEVPAGCTNKGRFRRDVTVPDGEQFAPAETFEKVWLVQNAGTCPWGPGYTVRLIGGDVMGANTETPLVEVVPPQANGEISVSMIAPAAAGHYRGEWQLFDLNGEPFGPELYLEIEVTPPDSVEIDESSLITLYDFIEKAGTATWTSGAVSYTPLETEINETVEFPAPQGLVAIGPALLRGNIESDGNVLLTYPHRKFGFIEGSYIIDTPLQPTDALVATLSFIKLPILPDDGVTFEVIFTPANGSEQVILSSIVQYRDSPVSVIQPLTNISPGQTGTFTLRVLGGESLSQDWAVWTDLRLIRP